MCRVAVTGVGLSMLHLFDCETVHEKNLKKPTWLNPLTKVLVLRWAGRSTRPHLGVCESKYIIRYMWEMEETTDTHDYSKKGPIILISEA